MTEEWVIKHRYSIEEWEEDQAELRHGVPLDKFLYSRMRRELSNYFLKEDIPPKSGHMWFYEGSCDLEARYCELVVRYAHDPEERWILKKADIPENNPKPSPGIVGKSENYEYVWNIIQETFTVQELANMRNRIEQCLKLL